MRCAILGFVAGAAWLENAATLPDQVTLLAGLAVLLFGARFLRAVPRALLCGALLGYAWAALLAHLALVPALDKADEGRDITLVGTIDSLPYRFEQGVRFNFAVERVLGAPLKVPPHIALGWYEGAGADAAAVGEVQPGERWQLTVRLQRPHGNANPYGFDYEVWLLEQGLRATGYVRSAGQSNHRLDAFVPSVGNVIELCRATLRDRIQRALPGKKYAGVLVALVVGDQRAIDHGELH